MSNFSQISFTIVRNIYVPPVSSCPHGYLPNFALLFSAPGWHNHHWRFQRAWRNQDVRAANRGEIIVGALDNSQLTTINQDSPTRKPSNGPYSSPHLTITNCHLGLHSSWNPVTTLNSDHLTIVTDLYGWFSQPPSPGPSCSTSYRKATWTTFTAETEIAFSNIHLMLHRREYLPHDPADSPKISLQGSQNIQGHCW